MLDSGVYGAGLRTRGPTLIFSTMVLRVCDLRRVFLTRRGRKDEALNREAVWAPNLESPITNLRPPPFSPADEVAVAIPAPCPPLFPALFCLP